MCVWGMCVKFVLVIILRPYFNIRKVSKIGEGDVASQTIVKLEVVQCDRRDLAREECLDSVNLIAKEPVSHERSSP